MNYEERINKRVRDIKPSGIRKFFDIVSEMPDAISLGVGEPDFVTPWHIRDAAIKSIQKGYTAYTSNMGLLELRREISGYLKNRFDLRYNESEIIVTVGASEGIDLSLRTLVGDGDEVLVPDPSYVSYQPNVAITGGTAVPVKTHMEDGFKLTPAALEAAITPRTKAVILPYPNNPTGAILTKAELEALVPVILRHDLFVISDEIYAELTYGSRHVSIASLPDMRERTVVISGFSKAFAMTGWRLGYVCAPLPILGAMFKIHQYTIMCAATPSQYGALAALTEGKQNAYEAVADMRNQYDMRRRFLVSEMNRIGLACCTPHGAFYIFPCVRSTGLTGAQFAEKLLRSKHVAVVPGESFGESGTDFIRCSYAASMARLTTAMQRIEAFVKEL